MSETSDRPAQTTRQQVLRAAAHQFAKRPYHEVGLDDILAEAELTKGAMYFHFRSKRALAVAVIEERAIKDAAAVRDLLARKLSGLETLVEMSYLTAVQDISRDAARAVLHLLPVVGRADELQARVVRNWVQTLTAVAERAVAEGDVIDGCEPDALARVLLSLYLGQRQTSDLDEPQPFLSHVEEGWLALLPGIVPPGRIDYFRQFIGRRTALAIKATSAGAASDVNLASPATSTTDGC
jgi:AcrR family transcriptional regulator